LLFNSVEFFLFFAVVVSTYFRAPTVVRWPLALAGIAFPLLSGPGSLESVAAAIYVAGFLGLVAFFRTRGAGGGGGGGGGGRDICP